MRPLSLDSQRLVRLSGPQPVTRTALASALMLVGATIVLMSPCLLGIHAC